MVFLSGGKQCTSRALLAASLRRYWGDLVLPKLDKTQQGKPYFPACPHLHTSLTHSGQLVLCALSCYPVGVDLELLLPRRASLPRYALTPSEFSQWEAQGKSWKVFYRLWTRKEAWCKFTGEGLAPSLRKNVPETGLNWASYHGETWLASLCGLEDLPQEICWLDTSKEEDDPWQS